MSTFTRRLALASLPFVFVVAACGAGGATTAPSAAPSAAPTEAPSEAPSAAPSEAPSEAPSAAAATVALSETSLGMVLVDAEGKTLYGFTADTAGESTCYDQCATNWPPLLAEDAASIDVGDGLDASLLTTVARTDGTTQVKYGDWPLYYFAADTAPGDTNGQGVGEVWYVVGADGALIGQ
jgi:predicted lipoprotein with Yx(FWY)xxD motif